MKKHKKQVFIAFCIILIITLISGIGCFFYLKNKESKKNVDNNSISVRFETSDIIEIKNILPVSDSLGKSFTGEGTEEGVQGFVEFSVTNVLDESVNYEVYLTKQESSNEIKDNYVKFYLTDFSDNPVSGYEGNLIPTYYSLAYMSDKPSSKLLYTGKLDAKSSNEFRLRIWLSDNYAISNFEESFKVDVDVRVK